MKSKPPFEPVYIFLVLALLAFAVADLTGLYFRGKFLPDTPPKSAIVVTQAQSYIDRSAYGPITARNIFNADGKIPDPLNGAGSKGQDAPPIPGTLGFNLVGTLVHVNPLKSVATISIRGKPDPDAFMVDSDIKDGTNLIAKMIKIERNKVTYRNVQTGLLEFIEIKEDSKITFAGGKAASSGPAIEQLSENFVRVSRDELNKKLADLPNLLMQARAVPRMGPDGAIQCFQMVGIQPGSVYESLGIKVGDCIKTVEGQPIDSQAKAMELFQKLKNSASIQLGVERNGSDQTLNFEVQ